MSSGVPRWLAKYGRVVPTKLRPLTTPESINGRYAYWPSLGDRIVDPRDRPTDIEAILYRLLDELDIIYAPQYRFGRFVADAYLSEHKLVIEADGSYWHRNTQERDARKDAFLRSVGLKVLRLTDQQLYELDAANLQKLIANAS